MHYYYIYRCTTTTNGDDEKKKKNERRREIKSYEWRKGIEGQFSSRKATIQSNLCVFDREKERRKRKILK
jgi:hypothetical protein